MSAVRDRCPACARRLITTRFDTTFRLPDRSERLCFGIPGGLCEDCSQLYIDPDLIELLDLGEGRCVFAIESDLVVQEQAWSSADCPSPEWPPPLVIGAGPGVSRDRRSPPLPAWRRV